MLSKLTIKNVALIKQIEIDFTNGLNVLSGETGAGKSVILDSINFVLGAKADKNMIRNGQTECFVCAEFIVNNSLIKNTLEELDVENDETLIISRKYNQDGKNSIKINGTPANVTMLKKLTPLLIDVHGQSEHYNLLSSTNQLKLIDNLGEQDILTIKEKIKVLYEKLKEINTFLDKSGGDESQRAIRLDVLNYQINEIENSNIKDGEEEELIELKNKLSNQERIINSLSLAVSAIQEEGGIIDVLHNVLRAINSISSFDTTYESINERLNNVYAEINDIESDLSSFINDFSSDGQSLDSVLERLETIKNIKKKYGANFEEIQAFLTNAIKERDALIKYDEIFADYIIKKERYEKDIYKLYIQLSEYRRKYAKTFSENVLKELKNLGMKNANFSIDFCDLPSISSFSISKNGLDKLEFSFSANKGEPLKPLANVISGGEMSRFMLAIKTQSSINNEVSTYVFDEIDAGISGITAMIVAQKLCDISKHTQVIAISHLPQISSFADNNLLIVKTETENDTETNVKNLNNDEKINEIIRLVGGTNASDSAKILAKELIENANNYKNK